MAHSECRATPVAAAAACAARTNSGRVLLWAAMVLAVVAALLGVAPGRAAADDGTGGYFGDDDGSVHEPALDALASQGVLAGIECGEGLICPSKPLKRWEMAVWLVRVLDDAESSTVATPSFSDVDYGAWWAPFVERLFEMGITVGCGRDPLQYCPDSSVSRAQMATFLKRAFDLEPAPAAGFTDVSGASHGANINALAAAGITVGCSRDPLQYCPDRSVTRAQMASFLARALGLIELPAAVRFTAIDAGFGHTCGLRADNTISCWDGNYFRQSDAPDGEFLAVSAGRGHSCAIRADRTVVCWGNNEFGQTKAPDGEFLAVSAGSWLSCGVRTDGGVACWGGKQTEQFGAPAGEFDAVAAGHQYACASGDSGLICWDDSEMGIHDVPDGRLVALSAGIGHACGLRSDDSTVACWGSNSDGESDAPAGPFSAVSAGGEHTCGLRPDQTIVCWGEDGSGQIEAPDGGFQAVTAGGTHSCGLRLDGTTVCWGDTADDRSRAPEGQFAAVSAGERHTCGLLTDSRIACWGHSGSGRAYAAPGEFKDVRTGQAHTCAVGADSTAVCWGEARSGETEAPEGRFDAVAAGSRYSCGLRLDETVVCWGENPVVEDVPAARFKAISTGSVHACGLRYDDTVACWGAGLNGETQAPEGKFKSVSAGDSHSCGLRLDETVVCWGRNSWGETGSPAGKFRAVSAGGGHTCGIREDHSAVCWGNDSTGQAQAPAGSFRTVAAGRRHSCGIRLDHSAVCWGYDTVVRPAGVRSPTDPGHPGPSGCRVYGVSTHVTAGFPLPRWAAPSSGTVRVAVLFMDFPDATASSSTRVEAGESLDFAERYLEEASYGSLDIEFVPVHRWLRSEHEHTHYLPENRQSLGYTQLRDFDSEAARLADPYVDFLEYDILMTVLPGQHFSGGTAIGSVETDEGVVPSTVRINALSPLTRFIEGRRDHTDWGWVAAHELLHTLGLADLYPRRLTVEPIEGPPGRVRLPAWFGIMGLETHFLLNQDDPRVRHYFGAREGRSRSLRALDGEILAWSRWQLGWLQADQVRCVTGDDETVVLEPVAADPGTGTAMAAIPLTANEAIVIESRRLIGRDKGRLIEEGVLVYRVNASISTGRLPIKVVGVPDGGFPVLQVGESVTVRGYTITVVADDGDTHTVSITKTGDG